ncbi:DUF951 domain-containing protein [soil metagenome]
MAERVPLEFRVGDQVELLRRHPCGATTWRVDRLGADIGILCDGCGHRVLIERRQLERRLKAIVERGSP